MTDFSNLFDDFYDSYSSRSRIRGVAKSESTKLAESLDTLPNGPLDEYHLQKQIRPVFGKQGLNESRIGTHPDFLELENNYSSTKHHYVCTIFVDIKGSTRLSLLYPLEQVYQFKDAVIKTCIEIIRSLDGHVHRIMGDAVMAFFGGRETNKEDSIADAINCIVVLRSILEGSIKPWMERNGFDTKDFGFRVGCDFGDDNEVLWGSYGYSNVGEVSATGLSVDMASKLQTHAGKNQAMLGKGLLEYVNWPEPYSSIKQSDRNGNSDSHPVVTPNITDANGNPINYTMRQLDYYKCLKYSALPTIFKEDINGTSIISNPAISYKSYKLIDGNREEYISASHFLDKNISLEFEVTANTKHRLSFPLRVAFSKTNHGTETPEEERDKEQAKPEKYLRKVRIDPYSKTVPSFAKVNIEESTLYRGLHTMKCEITDSDGKIVFRNWIGVMIK